MNVLESYFDRVVVINLDHRRDRWQAFQKALETVDWPFKPPERFPAVAGDQTTVPIWWKQGGGAWGCLMSHARILEDCLRTDVQRVLILEDDAVFVEDFAEQARGFLDHVPDDWDQLYFGGQHLLDPAPFNEFAYRCRNINRTHAYAVSRTFMPRMYRYILNAHDYIEHPGHHIDHRLGALHETGTVKVFAPRRWIAGQGQNTSDISGRSHPTYYWNTWADVVRAPMTVVLGLHAGDANRVAGLMRKLNVHFGHTLRGYEKPRVEDKGLAVICERVFPFPHTKREIDPDDSCPSLHDWCRLILREAANYGTSGAACYPTLCALYPDMAKAWPHLRVVNVEMPLEEAVRRLQRRSRKEHGWLRITDEQAASVQAFLAEGKQEWLAHCEHLTLSARRVRRAPKDVLQDLTLFLKNPKPARASSQRASTHATIE